MPVMLHNLVAIFFFHHSFFMLLTFFTIWFTYALLFFYSSLRLRIVFFINFLKQSLNEVKQDGLYALSQNIITINVTPLPFLQYFSFPHLQSSVFNQYWEYLKYRLYINQYHLTPEKSNLKYNLFSYSVNPKVDSQQSYNPNTCMHRDSRVSIYLYFPVTLRTPCSGPQTYQVQTAACEKSFPYPINLSFHLPPTCNDPLQNELFFTKILQILVSDHFYMCRLQTAHDIDL